MKSFDKLKNLSSEELLDYLKRLKPDDLAFKEECEKHLNSYDPDKSPNKYSRAYYFEYIRALSNDDRITIFTLLETQATILNKKGLKFNSWKMMKDINMIAKEMLDNGEYYEARSKGISNQLVADLIDQYTSLVIVNSILEYDKKLNKTKTSNL